MKDNKCRIVLQDQRKKRKMVSQVRLIPEKKYGRLIALILCAMVLISGILSHFFGNQPQNITSQSPYWIPIFAAALAASGIMRFAIPPLWLRVQRAVFSIGFLLMVWVANGLLFDLIHLTTFLPGGKVDLGGMMTRIFALSAVIMMARLILSLQQSSASVYKSTWYGYAAFILALPYPVLRICWAFGGTIGITFQGAAGTGFAPLLFAIPWILATILSLFLASPPVWMPRRLLLTAGWCATVIVSIIGPAACWSIVYQFLTDTVQGPDGMKLWVPCLFYSSWLLWAIAAGAATLSYQFRSAVSTAVPDDLTFQKTL
jgi:hypothetical protein